MSIVKVKSKNRTWRKHKDTYDIVFSEESTTLLIMW